MSDDEDRLRELINELAAEVDAEGDLESTPPREAFELWLDSKTDSSDATIESYEYRMRQFLAFLDQREIDDLSELSTRDIKEFQIEREAAGLQRNTRNNEFGTLRQFLAFCYELNAVPEGVVKALDVPSVDKEDRVNTEKLIADRAEEILENLEQYRYASRDHTVFLLLWRTAMRVGAVHSLDVADCFLDREDDEDRLYRRLEAEDISSDAIADVIERASFPFLWPQHRPETGTPLKNDSESERVINISETTAQVLRDYIRVNRPEATDDHGREPLITSRKGTGRLSPSAIRNTTYILTQPCEFGDACPYGEDPEECVAREHGHGSKCPGSRSPHKIRTGSITHHRDRGWPIDDLADKADTSEELIRGVYDQPEQVIRGASRRDHLDRLEDD